MKNNFANHPTPTSSKAWLDTLPEDRMFMLRFNLNNFFKEYVEVVDAKDDGQVVLRMLKNFPAKERGILLLDIEDYLKEVIDKAITVWLDPQGDKSSLRNLRGIEIKS